MKRVAILHICTGKYSTFWPGFYENFEKYFLPDCDKTYFVFTDDTTLSGGDNVRFIPQEALAWPYASMLRFRMFLRVEEQLAAFDYAVFANANLRCTGPILSGELLPDPAAGQTLLAVCHLPYYGKRPIFHPYERSPKSRAGIPYNCGTYYVAGGLNGGTAQAFLALCHELDARTQEDLDRGVIARCHDESQLNRFVAEQPARFRILTPEFCVPEETPIEGQRIVILQKKRTIDMDSIKGKAPRQNWFQRKWEAFTLNWLPYLWYARDTLVHKTLG